MARRRHDPVRAAVRFAWTLPVILLALAGFSAWRGHTVRASVVAGLAVVPPLLAHLGRPAWMRFYAGWMRFAELLGLVSTTVILTIFFFLVLTPVGLAVRLFRRDPLDLAWKDGRKSYWVEREPVEPTYERYEKQY